MSTPTGNRAVAQWLSVQCAKASHVEAAWVSASGEHIAIQGIVGTRSFPDPEHRGWTRTDPVFHGTTTDGTRELNDLAARCRSAFPQVHTAYIVSYVLRPGPSWTMAWRKEDK